MLSPRIWPILSNVVVLPRRATAGPVIVALLIATTTTEEWPRGKARGGNTVDFV